MNPPPTAVGVSIDEGGHGRLSRNELLALCAAIMATMAVALDLMLPAFGDIESEFSLQTGQIGQVITVFFFGLALAQLVYGPLADALGRKPVLYLAVGIYVLGAVISALASTFTVLLIGRFVWGVGAAGARVVAVAIIRDRFAGSAMAKAMSQMMAVFVLVPIIAPGLGAVVLIFAPWRSLFWICGVLSAGLVAWSLRLSETLDPARQRPLNLASTIRGYVEVSRTPITFGYTIGSIFLQGIFTAYLASSESIIDEVWDLRPWFPWIFGAVAILFGVGAIINGKVVERLGIDRVVDRAFGAMVPLAALLTIMSLMADGAPSIWLFMPVLGVMLTCMMFLMPNLGSAAMTPVGHLAGSGSALTGATRTAGGALIATAIARWTEGSATGLSIAVAVMAVLAAACVALTRVRNPAAAS